MSTTHHNCHLSRARQRRIISLLSVALLSSAFGLTAGDHDHKAESAHNHKSETVHDHKAESSHGHQGYGAAMPDGEPRALSAVYPELAAHQGKRLKLRGRVASVCQSAGCWMMLSDSDLAIRVSFDQFVIPKDAQGESVVYGEILQSPKSETSPVEYSISAISVQLQDHAVK